MYKYTSYTKRPLLKLALPFCIALAYGPSTAMAATILGSDLASFAVLGGSTVINTGATTLKEPLIKLCTAALWPEFSSAAL